LRISDFGLRNFKLTTDYTDFTDFLSKSKEAGRLAAKGEIRCTPSRLKCVPLSWVLVLSLLPNPHLSQAGQKDGAESSESCGILVGPSYVIVFALDMLKNRPFFTLKTVFLISK
jgi:hypothetical protein